MEWGISYQRYENRGEEFQLSLTLFKLLEHKDSVNVKSFILNILQSNIAIKHYSENQIKLHLVLSIRYNLGKLH